jgi:hypothetical protein
MKIAKWTIAAITSYGATFWIKNIVWNILISIVIWYLSLWILDKILEGDF